MVLFSGLEVGLCCDINSLQPVFVNTVFSLLEAPGASIFKVITKGAFNRRGRLIERGLLIERIRRNRLEAPGASIFKVITKGAFYRENTLSSLLTYFST